MQKNTIDLKETTSISNTEIKKEEVTIEDLHRDIEKKLEEQGVIFDRKKFFFQDKGFTFSEQLADSVAKFGGSWKFLIAFSLFLFGWIFINYYILSNRSWDPFPFILLNLILSCLASVQAPIIMMSQNRQAEKEKRQQELNLEKDIVDFKQDRLDLILDQKEWDMLQEINDRLKRIEARLSK